MFRVAIYENNEVITTCDYEDITIAIHHITDHMTDKSLEDIGKNTYTWLVYEPITSTIIRRFTLKMC